jgi:hypothetical protein
MVSGHNQEMVTWTFVVVTGKTVVPILIFERYYMPLEGQASLVDQALQA